MTASGGSEDDPRRLLVTERLAVTGLDMRPTAPMPRADAPTPVWRFVSAEGDIEVGVHLADDQAGAVAIWERLGGDRVVSSAGQPARVIGVTGSIAFDVRFVGPPERQEDGRWRVFDVASALAGGE